MANRSPFAVAVSPDGTIAFVSDRSAGNVTILNIAAKTKVGEVALHKVVDVLFGPVFHYAICRQGDNRVVVGVADPDRVIRDASYQYCRRTFACELQGSFPLVSGSKEPASYKSLPQEPSEPAVSKRHRRRLPARCVGRSTARLVAQALAVPF